MTRHNAGFLALDHFAGRVGQSIVTVKNKGVYGTFRLAGKQVFLLKPMDFMNRSGECVAALARYFAIVSEDILVIHDDLDLAPGRLKIAAGGGAGGHNGIRSLISQLGTSDFARFKIGIGHPRDNAETAPIPVERFVLSRFSDSEWHDFQNNLDTIHDGIRLFITDGKEAAMNMINRKQSRPA